MSFSQTITASQMRRINTSAILELIRREGLISRTEIAQKLGVSLSTVMRIVDELAEENFIQPMGEAQSSGGRPRSLLRFNGTAHVVVGIDLGGANIFGAVSDLDGNILHEVSAEQHDTGGEESYRRLVELIEELLTSPALSGREMRGIGVGAPGVTLHQQGIVTWAPSLNWREFPLKARLTEHFGLPVIVDNDVNLAALGELWFGLEQPVQNLVLITIGTGIGAGIIIDGALYRGAREAAGEIGYFLPGQEHLGKRYENFGAFESLASGTGVVERARRALASQRNPDELDRLSAEDVFAAARRGERWARGIVDETVDYLAIAVAGVSALLDPDLIVLGGVSSFADLLIGPVLQRIEGTVPVPPRLVASKIDRRAVVMGTIIGVLHHTTDYHVVRRFY